MEEKILELLKSENRAFSVYEIQDGLGFHTADELRSLLVILNQMEDHLQIYRTKKDNYMLFHNSHLKIGVMIAHKKGFGFVDIEGDEDVYVSIDHMNHAIHGDKVVVEIISKKGFDLEGKIVKIVDRKLKDMVGEFYYQDGIGHIHLDDDRVKLTILVDPDKSQNAMDGHKVIVRILNKVKDNTYHGEVVRILGHKNDPGVDILSICGKYDIHDLFPDSVIKELDDIPMSVSKEEMAGRRDLRDQCIFTIDGDDTKDIDDAISIEKLDNGHYRLGVHIADVSYYVRAGKPLDEEAFARGTSVYLADRVIPMLPHKLSNGICSLNPNVDRLAISCVMEIDETGKTVDYDIFESVICSKKQMTYKNVNKILESDEIPDGYIDFVDSLHFMADLALILRKYKEKRGYIDFDLEEAKIIVNENGEAVDVALRERGAAEKLIEDFMIAANETVASHIYYMELPFIYRIHGEPKEEKVQNFLHFVGILGYKINGKMKDITPHTMQSILEQLKDTKEFPIFSSLLLRSMQKAVYDKTNIGHFGIASKCYTHFTSPIRRYPDTIVHRLLRTYLFQNKMDADTIRYWDQKLVLIGEQSSYKERQAIECEREVDDMKKAEYMMQHIGEEFDGIITSVMSFGMFVELPNKIEGLIRVEDLKGDYYEFNEATFSLVGKRNKRGYRLGDSIKVVVKSANKEMHTVDFELAKSKPEGSE